FINYFSKFESWRYADIGKQCYVNTEIWRFDNIGGKRKYQNVHFVTEHQFLRMDLKEKKFVQHVVWY
ncbi:MAG: hypothetical protein P8Y18_08150, partial [Candidatus Bathyarchaeota archaeon]